MADTTKRAPTRVATPNPQPTRVGQRSPGDGLPRGPLGEKAVPGATRIANQHGEARTSVGGAGGTNSTPPKFTDRTACQPLPASNQRQVGMRKTT